LRNQQFMLGTLALTGSGLSAWIVTSKADESVAIGVSLSWLLMLFILFHWSIALRKLITIISEYLKVHQLSKWETAFYVLHQNNSRLIPSQTLFIVIVFLLYGVIVVAGSLVSLWSTVDTVSGFGYIALLTSLFGYSLAIVAGYRRFRVQNAALEKLCRTEFAKAE